MNLRDLPDGLSPAARCDERRSRVEKEAGTDLSMLVADDVRVGQADEKNCEQMIGMIGLPVGIAGPLRITLSNKKTIDVLLPLATTEGALVASVNRGCKVLSKAGGVTTEATNHGISRSIAFQIISSTTSAPIPGRRAEDIEKNIRVREEEWKKEATATSGHLTLLDYDIDCADGFLFLTLHADTDEAMGMNMITIAAQATGMWIEKNIEGLRLITVAGNVDSDKKPSLRTYERGRGFEVFARAVLTPKIVDEVLKTTPNAIMEVAKAKLETGSVIAGALGSNLHAANIIAALYLSTGQDAAHVVEGSMADTAATIDENGNLAISVRIPAVLVGVRGGGTGLPAQHQCLELLLKTESGLHRRQQLAETIGAAVLAGEISLLAAQATQALAKAHKDLGR